MMTMKVLELCAIDKVSLSSTPFTVFRVQKPHLRDVEGLQFIFYKH